MKEMGGDAHNKMLPTYFIKVIEGHGNHSAVGKGREATQMGRQINMSQIKE